MKPSIVLAITGASGAVYCVRLLEVLLASGRDVDLVISPSGKTVLEHELGLKVDLKRFSVETLVPDQSQLASDSRLHMIRTVAGVSTGQSNVLSFVGKEPGTVRYHFYQNFMSPIASGSHVTEGMVVCPCSGSTLSAIASGASNNLIQRAAEVHLKEQRKLVLVPRETPLSLVHIENLRRCAEAGAVLLPAMPGFYHEPKSIQDLVDFVVARICDQLNIPNNLVTRWGESKRRAT